VCGIDEQADSFQLSVIMARWVLGNVIRQTIIDWCSETLSEKIAEKKEGEQVRTPWLELCVQMARQDTRTMCPSRSSLFLLTKLPLSGTVNWNATWRNSFSQALKGVLDGAERCLLVTVSLLNPKKPRKKDCGKRKKKKKG
jgi:hypothetical protein